MGNKTMGGQHAGGDFRLGIATAASQLGGDKLKEAS